MAAPGVESEKEAQCECKTQCCNAYYVTFIRAVSTIDLGGFCMIFSGDQSQPITIQTGGGYRPMRAQCCDVSQHNANNQIRFVSGEGGLILVPGYSPPRWSSQVICF